jgi:hypothetical protein
MADNITYNGQKLRKAKPGGKMTGGTGWRLGATKGQRRYFVGTRITTFNFGKKVRLAVFSVPK